jgi:hypothetical protein
MAQKTILFSINAGSTLYGLDVEGSDLDHRGVFVGQEPNIYRRGEVDSLYLRLDRALQSVVKSTQTLELFYAPKQKFSYIRQDFYSLAMGPMARNLVDTRHLYESYEAYVIKHIEIGAGLRLPKNQDAKNNLLYAKYGYVPKGFVHAIRASMQVAHWIKSEFEEFPSDLDSAYPLLAVKLRTIKSDPKSFSKESLLKESVEALAKMKDIRAKTIYDRVPNPEYVDFLLKMFGQEKLAVPENLQ